MKVDDIPAVTLDVVGMSVLLDAEGAPPVKRGDSSGVAIQARSTPLTGDGTPVIHPNIDVGRDDAGLTQTGTTRASARVLGAQTSSCAAL